MKQKWMKSNLEKTFKPITSKLDDDIFTNLSKPEQKRKVKPQKN